MNIRIPPKLCIRPNEVFVLCVIVGFLVSQELVLKSFTDITPRTIRPFCSHSCHGISNTRSAKWLILAFLFSFSVTADQIYDSLESSLPFNVKNNTLSLLPGAGVACIRCKGEDNKSSYSSGEARSAPPRLRRLTAKNGRKPLLYHSLNYLPLWALRGRSIVRVTVDSLRSPACAPHDSPFESLQGESSLEWYDFWRNSIDTLQSGVPSPRWSSCFVKTYRRTATPRAARSHRCHHHDRDTSIIAITTTCPEN